MDVRDHAAFQHAQAHAFAGAMVRRTQCSRCTCVVHLATYIDVAQAGRLTVPVSTNF
jgi:hypothetical protein